MTHVNTSARPAPSPLPRTCYCTDREILIEIAEMLSEVGDVRYNSATVDVMRSQITCTLEDGRKLLITARFDVKSV